jgi:hypothetical protein
VKKDKEMIQNLHLRKPDAPIGQGKNSGFYGNQWHETPGEVAVLLCDSYLSKTACRCLYDSAPTIMR